VGIPTEAVSTLNAGECLWHGGWGGGRTQRLLAHCNHIVGKLLIFCQAAILAHIDAQRAMKGFRLRCMQAQRLFKSTMHSRHMHRPMHASL